MRRSWRVTGCLMSWKKEVGMISPPAFFDSVFFFVKHTIEHYRTYLMSVAGRRAAPGGFFTSFYMMSDPPDPIPNGHASVCCSCLAV